MSCCTILGVAMPGWSVKSYYRERRKLLWWPGNSSGSGDDNSNRDGSGGGCCGGLAVSTASCQLQRPAGIRRPSTSGSSPGLGVCDYGGTGGGGGAHVAVKNMNNINRLPDELLRHILALVPLSELLRLRGVCRAWNRLVLDDARVAQVRGSCAACFLRAVRSRDGKMLAVVYNPVRRASGGAHLPLHASPAEFGHFITAAGGLLFYGTFNNCAPVCRITVSNPLSNTWRRLPLLADGPTPLSFPAFRRITAWMVDTGGGAAGGGGGNKLDAAAAAAAGDGSAAGSAQSRSSHYKVLVVKFRCHFQTHMYDSALDAWTPCPSIPLCGFDFFADLYTSTGPCVHGAAFYVVGASAREVRSWSIWAFDLHTEAWFNLAVPAKVLDGGVVSFVLTECLGHLVLVARSGTVDWDKRCVHVDGVRLWELKLTRTGSTGGGSSTTGSSRRSLAGHSSCWTKLGDMPPHLVPHYSHFYSKRHWWHPTLELRDCTAVAHCIFFLKGRAHGSDAIMYDFLDRSWSCRDAVQLPRGYRMYEPGFCYTPDAASIP